jgi:ferredoxin
MTAFYLTIDPVACDAYGFCAELLPEAVRLDEWGLPAELVARARRAARDCPRRAVSLRQRESGRGTVAG